jgi:hypothetical protein
MSGWRYSQDRETPASAATTLKVIGVPAASSRRRVSTAAWRVLVERRAAAAARW